MAGMTTRLQLSARAFADLLPLAIVAGPELGQAKSGPAHRPGR